MKDLEIFIKVSILELNCIIKISIWQIMKSKEQRKFVQSV